MIAISKLTIGGAEKQAVMEALDSGMLAQGPRTAKFEERFAEICSVKHAIISSPARPLYTSRCWLMASAPETR